MNGVNKSVSYGQGSSTATIASALASAIANDGGYPVTASANGATVNLTARTAGTAANGYGLSASTTWNTSYFGAPSFTSSKSGNTLAGGVDGSVIYDSGTVTLTIAGCSPFTVNYANGSTRDSVATALRSAVNADGLCPVTAGGTGTTVSLASDATGSGVNYGLSWSATTSQSSYFGSPSFSLATSGMSGGQDMQPATLATPAVTLYTYDTLDNLTCAVQKGTDTSAFSTCGASPAAWRPRSFSYNSLSQLTQAVNPESGTISYAYDNDGNLLTKTSPKPNQTNPAVTVTATHTYDALHRLTQKSFDDLVTPGVSYFYDQTSYNGLTIGNGKGQRTGMSDASGTTAWSYDITANTGWKTTERRTLNGVTKTTVSQNNLAGGLTQLTNPSGTVVNYGFDSAGRSISAAAGLDTYVQGVTYAPHGALATLGNGSGFGGGAINSTYFYNNRLQPCRVHVRTSLGAPADCNSASVGNVLDFKYSFNAGVANNGNVTQIENKRDTNRTQNFTYDELNRVKTAQTQATSGTHAWGLQFGYDIWANLLSATVTQGSAPALSVGAGSDNRILGYCYDAAGNLLIEAPCGGTVTYTYDAENRITTTGGVTYTYDGDGKRVKKSNGKLYWGELAESDLAGAISDEYIFFGGKRIARRIVATSTVHYYFADHLGSSRIVTNASGGILEDSDFYPFGGERVVVDSTDNRYKFTGKERDSESGLDYFGARYYASLSGRFLTPDWATAPTAVPYADYGDPQSLNLYTYVGNNPITRFDTDGHCWPVSECAAKFQNAVNAATDAVVGAAVSTGSPLLAGTATALAGTARDLVNGTADAFRAGEAVGACQDSCNEIQMAEALGQDFGRTAGLFAMAAGGGEAALEKATQRTLTRAADEALETVGPGKGGVHGTKVHTEFADKVKQSGRSDLHTEVSYKNGDVVPRGTTGSVRADVVRGDPTRPSAVYDLKTGGAKLTAARQAELQQHLPRQAPIKEVRPR